ncbi:MAG: TOBE domain-containing protein [Comamonas sp.]
MALIKASAVTLVTDADGMRFSARNQFEGVVARVNKGAVNSEVLLTLPGGEQLVAIVTNESAEGLEMAAGQKALAMFKAGSAILAVKA